MENYPIYFLIAFVLSVFFSMAGAGAGVAVIPILSFLGIEFNLSKAVGLFGGFVTTFTSTLLNIKRKLLELSFALPIAAGMFVFAPIGAFSCKYLDVEVVKMFYAFFLFFSATIMMFFKRKPKFHLKSKALLLIVGVIVGFLAGVLGVGGGNLLLPALVLLGFEPKKVAVAVSFIVPFSTFASFVSYLTFVKIDWLLLLSVSIGAFLGALVGNNLLHTKLSQQQIKKVIAILLYLLAIKLMYNLNLT